MSNPIRAGYLLIAALSASGLIVMLAVFAGLPWWAGLILLAVLDVAIIGRTYRSVRRLGRATRSP